MARIKNNLILQGLAGKLGNVVLRTRNGKTSMYILSPSEKPRSQKQKDYQQKFAEAVAFAKSVLADEEMYALYAKKAKKSGKESAYAMAIAEYMGKE